MRSIGLPSFSARTAAHQLTIAIVVASVLYGLLGNYGIYYLTLIPLAVIQRFEIWRPFTALLIAPSPMEVIFGALIVYSIGGGLEQWYGRRRFFFIALGIPLIASFLTIPIALLVPSLFRDTLYTGASSIVTTIWIIFGIRSWFSGQMLNFWGVPLTGKNFALIGLGFVILQGVFNGFPRILPDLISAGLSYGYMYRRPKFNPLRALENAYDKWKLHRLKAKRGLHVVNTKSPRKNRDDDIQIH